MRGAGLDAADAWRTGYRHARGAALPHGRHRGAKRLARNDGAFPRRFPAVRTRAPSQCALRGLWARKPLPFEALVQLMRCNSATWEQMGAEGMGARSAVTTEGTGCNSEIAKAQVLSLPLSLPLSRSLTLSLSLLSPGRMSARARAGCWTGMAVCAARSGVLVRRAGGGDSWCLILVVCASVCAQRAHPHAHRSGPLPLPLSTVTRKHEPQSLF